MPDQNPPPPVPLFEGEVLPTALDFPDLMGHPNISDPPTNIGADRRFQFNIDDPNWTLEKWTNSDLNLSLPAVEKDPPTCEDNCEERAKLRRKNCEAVRKRVADALKKIGCPSKVTAYATPKKGCSRASKATKSTTTTKRTTTRRTTGSRR